MLARLDPQRFRNLHEHGDACRHIAALDRADIARAPAGARVATPSLAADKM